MAWWHRSDSLMSTLMDFIEGLYNSGGSADGLLLRETVNLTDAQIKALPSTPVEIVSAQGANTLIVPHITILAHAWVADYTNINATSHIKVDLSGTFSAALHENTLNGVSNLLAGGDPAVVPLLINQLAQAVLTTATPHVNTHFHQGAADSGWFYADVVNRALRISMENVGSGNLTGGNAGNVLRVTSLYSVVDVP